MLNNLLNKIPTLGLTGADCIAQTASQCFDISVWQFLTALLCGARVRIVPDSIAHDPAALLREVETHGVTVLESVPSLIGGMLEMAETPKLPKLRWLLPTGEAMPPDYCRRWLQRYPHTTLLNAYGPAECADDVAYHRIASPPSKAMPRLPIGRPVPNIKLYILNQFLEPVPIGVPGELYVAGIGVGRGYLNDPARAAQSFIPDFVSPQSGTAENVHLHSNNTGRLYKTGDRARFLADGTIEYLGRIDHQVKLRGYRVELGEIEARLQAHEAVDKAAAIVREDQPGDQRLVAYVVLVNDWQTEDRVEPLRRFLRERMPEYMMPSAFVFLDALPLSANGKLDRRLLPAPDWAGHTEQRYVAPRTETEQRVAAIWAKVLRLERVSIYDNFFDLGGHSLLATQIISRVQAAFDLDLPLRTLFEATTVAAMAEAMDVALWLKAQGAASADRHALLEDIEL
jgi:acyl-coenzyme A synthetase/AMP-(fatty) acid ligase/acyl carrier protein